MRLRFFACWVAVAFIPALHAQISVAGFTTFPSHGFQVLVNDQALANHPVPTQGAIQYVDTLLSRIIDLGLAPDILDSLRNTPIFMEWNFNNGSAWYHYGNQWLIQNGLNPAKGSSVEITNILNFVNWSRQNQPMILMHELAHAYHHRVLGLDYAPILAAYQTALNAGMYSSVPYYPGGGAPPFNQPAYGLTDNREYFAEITEAYLGRNDYFPFDSVDLRAFDLTGFTLVKSVWRFAAPASSEPAEAISPMLRAFPNPTEGNVLLEVNASRPLAAQLTDAQGRTIRSFSIAVGWSSCDLSSLAAGMYCLRVSDGLRAQVLRVVVQ